MYTSKKGDDDERPLACTSGLIKSNIHQTLIGVSRSGGRTKRHAMHGALYTIDRMYNSHKMAFDAKYGMGEHEIRIYLWLTCDLMCSFVR